jgi:hypothetical protein
MKKSNQKTSAKFARARGTPVAQFEKGFLLPFFLKKRRLLTE